MRELPPVSTSWSEGRYFDRWMLVHFLGGVTGAFSNVYFGLTIARVYAVGAALMVVWELAEYAVGVRESGENRLLDVVVGLAGVFSALLIAPSLTVTGQHVAFGVSVLAFVGGGAAGWIARRKRRAAAR